MNKPKTVHICAKCSDLCFSQVLDEGGAVIAEHDGYVPDFMPVSPGLQAWVLPGVRV